MITCDFSIDVHRNATHASIKPLNESAKRWLTANCAIEPWQWSNGSLCVEQRCFDAIFRGIIDADFTVFDGRTDGMVMQ